MPSFSGLLIITAVAFGAPFVLGLAPRVRLPAVVLEIVAGIVVGPSVLGWVHVDQTIAVISTLGLAFLLFLAGLEIDFSRLRGRVLRLTALGYGLSFAIALVVAAGLKAAGLADAPLLVAITLAATSLGVLIPVLKDAGESTSTLGQVVIAAGSIADFGAIILLSIFFTGEGGTGATLLLIGSLLGLALVVLIAVRGAERSMRIRADLLRLQDTTAQIRVRGAMVLLVGFAAIAQSLGLEAILGAFAAGAILTLLDADEVMTHPQFRRKLEAIGFGFFIPVFFVTTGVRYDLDALLASASTVVMVPIFLAALLAVRGLPALLYRRLLGPRQALIAGLLQSTSLPFIVAATAIGLDLGVVDAATSAALIAAGLLSVVIFPATGLALLRAGAEPRTPPPVAEETPLVAM
ncbi:cation:proton antiporter [Solirubrobacter ginsenosidimutans]|uniref:Cation:proton antiporter n=1 Tax=Solirubrobacter ginsenosidimutans TaxID=490573 RepID=A0A9X3MS68_9ACTN|nr:cation:proton antiporter [Solirubrobacter ginsenosidimutans]MDA0161674.1 cation:proton antiporter [Solirubrobacter ginsenosidimutans]